MSVDVVVIGGGPAGLCFARALTGIGLTVLIVEANDRSILAEPPDDGREIAITHRSQQIMRQLGLWRHIREHEIGILRDAKVIDGDDDNGLIFHHEDGEVSQLGWLLPNHAIRRAAFIEAMQLPDIKLLAGARVTAIRATDEQVAIELGNGETLRAQLVVAADSRFSETRRAMGIGADMHDFGKTMLVVRMRHEVPHEQLALEWFDTGQTLALLPLFDPCTSSVVLTLPPPKMQSLLALDDRALEADITRRFRRRFGSMRIDGPRRAYPLVGVYSRRFVERRFALVGDAAVGMHPLTAHGFNFGLLGVATLAHELRGVVQSGRPIWDPVALQRYEQAHRRATKPLYLATQWVATLYTDDSAPAIMARRVALGLSARLSLFRRLITRRLTQVSPDSPALQ